MLRPKTRQRIYGYGKGYETASAPPRRGPCGRIRYAGRGPAEVALTGLLASGWCRSDPRLLHPYFCRDCRSWHLGCEGT